MTHSQALAKACRPAGITPKPQIPLAFTEEWLYNLVNDKENSHEAKDIQS